MFLFPSFETVPEAFNISFVDIYSKTLESLSVFAKNLEPFGNLPITIAFSGPLLEWTIVYVSIEQFPSGLSVNCGFFASSIVFCR